MRCCSSVMPVVALAIALVSSPTFAGIGIFSTPDGTNCNLTLPEYGLPRQIYVLYLGEGGPMAMGAEYRIAGMPGIFSMNYTATLTPAPGSNLNLGNAFDGTGHNVAWPAVQPFDGNGNLLLATYTLTSWGANIPPGTILTVTGRLPWCGNCGCFGRIAPLIVDAEYNIICQTGGEVRVNGGPTCTVAVEQHTWTEVRSLYR